MADELRDRFGPLPWETQALLYSIRLKAASAKAGVESISRESGRIVIRMKYDVGSARTALRRRLPTAAEVGNAQIRLDLSRLHAGWEEPLLDLVHQLAEFSEFVSSQMSQSA